MFAVRVRRIRLKRSIQYQKYVFSRILKQKIIMISYVESIEKPNGYWNITLQNGTQWQIENLTQYPEVIKK